jgi:hypothetical protein
MHRWVARPFIGWVAEQREDSSSVNNTGDGYKHGEDKWSVDKRRFCDDEKHPHVGTFSFRRWVA